MANLFSIAKPYAYAAFEVARDQQQLAEWKAFLASAALVAKHADVKRLLANPEISSQMLLDLFKGVLASLLNQQRENFLADLTQKKRLDILPEISKVFDMYYAEWEKISNIRVITAVETNDAFNQKLSEALERRVKQKVKIQYEVNPAILGGAIIRIGDTVVDASIRERLRALELSLR